MRKRCLPAEGGPRFFWYTVFAGFGVIVHPVRSGAKDPTRTFVIQKEVRSRTVRTMVGRFPEWTAGEARKRARKLGVEMDEGSNPNVRKREEAARSTTPEEAIGWHQEAMRAKGCVPQSIETLRYELELHAKELDPAPAC